jgi:hypothetical protein
VSSTASQNDIQKAFRNLAKVTLEDGHQPKDHHNNFEPIQTGTSHSYLWLIFQRMKFFQMWIYEHDTIN